MDANRYRILLVRCLSVSLTICSARDAMITCPSRVASDSSVSEFSFLNVLANFECWITPETPSFPSMELIDLSHTLDSNIPIYPGDPTFSCCPFITIAKDGVNVHQISMGSHSGTHVDAPSHFVENGQSVDVIPLDRFVGRAIVIDLTGSEENDEKCKKQSDEVGVRDQPTFVVYVFGVFFLLIRRPSPHNWILLVWHQRDRCGV